MGYQNKKVITPKCDEAWPQDPQDPHSGFKLSARARAFADFQTQLVSGSSCGMADLVNNKWMMVDMVPMCLWM